MSNPVDDRPVNLKAFDNLPPDAPVVMINLLKFHPGDGLEHYLTYSREVQPHLDRVGGKIRRRRQPAQRHRRRAAAVVGRHPGGGVSVAAGVRRHGARPGLSEGARTPGRRTRAGDLVATSRWVTG